MNKKNRINKVSLFIIALLLCQLFLPTTASISSSQNFDFDAGAVILMDADSGRTMYENDGDKIWAPASLVKIMTLVVALEAIEEETLSLDETARTSTDAWQTGGSQMFLGENQEVNIEDLLKGIAVVSANDACIVLAEHMYGTVNGFVDKMNDKAKEIGLENTNFTDPIGFDHEEQYVTAKDMALLSKYAIENTPTILDLETIPEFTFNDISQDNRNLKLPERDTAFSYEGTDGLKTGNTANAGYNYVGTAKRNDLRLITVVLGAEEKNERFRISTRLMDYGFDEFQRITLFEKGEEMGSVEIQYGQEREAKMVSEQDFNVVTKLDNQDDLESKFLPIKDTIEAPIQTGEKLGELVIYEDNEEIGRMSAIAKDDIGELGFFGRIFRSITDTVSGVFQNIRDSILSFIMGDDE